MVDPLHAALPGDSPAKGVHKVPTVSFASLLRLKGPRHKQVPKHQTGTAGSGKQAGCWESDGVGAKRGSDTAAGLTGRKKWGGLWGERKGNMGVLGWGEKNKGSDLGERKTKKERFA